MPSETRRPERLRFFILTCRDPRSDFRLPLVEALRHHYETWYIWLRRRPIVSGLTGTEPPVEMSLPDFLRFIRRFRQDDKVNVYFNSTNTYFPGTTAVLRLLAAAGVWCLDMHDDLRYHNKGFKRWREGLIISLLRRLSHVTVHAAPTLQEMFPDSRHLGNASNILPLCRATNPNDDVLIIASFDERFDFDFLSALAQACPGTQFHLHGWTRPDDTPTMVQITAIEARHVNIHYHGSYTMADLPSILSTYRVSVAPYRTDTNLTRYIDPLRFYHCLNAGLEVVSTDIPQARYMRDWVHVVPDVAACVETLANIRTGASARQPSYSPITWELRADQLVEILRTLPRTIAFSRRRTAHRSASPTCRSLE
jgi:hypothetical protein